jgi:DNA-3-methyladenine glycosylase
MQAQRLSAKIYLQKDVVAFARKLLGKIICTQIEGQFTSGIIIETEAYAGEADKASHAFGGRRTRRTEIMYAHGGFAYVYLCYGIHYLFNVVTNAENIPHAVLIRTIAPLDGIEIMQARKAGKWNKSAAVGPGNVSKCLGIDMEMNTENLVNSSKIWIEDRGIIIPKNNIIASPRVGVDYAGEDAKLHYRFELKNKF